MKKFLIVSVMLFIASVGCKKMDIGGDNVCGCSPVTEGPELNLVIRNSAGQDLLSTSSATAVTKDQIKLYRDEGNGNIRQIPFEILPPFSYGEEKFGSNYLYTRSVQWNSSTQTDVIYLKIGDDEPYELTIRMKPEGRFSVHTLLINQKPAAKGEGNLAKFKAVYYLNK